MQGISRDMTRRATQIERKFILLKRAVSLTMLRDFPNKIALAIK
jgi:hypothetical protein